MARFSGRLAVVAPWAVAILVAAGAPLASSGQAPAAKPQVKAADKVKKATGARTLIDLNKATAEQMVEVLPGVGEVTAKKIVDGRPYEKVEDLAKAGIPARTIAGIRPLVTVSAPAPAAPTATAKAPAKKSAPKKVAAKAVGDAPSPAAAGHAAKVNLNTATADELQTLPGIGPVYAKEIIGLRPIKKLADLEKVKGLGKERIEELDEYVVILAPKPAEPAAPAPAPAPTTTTAKTKGKAAVKKPATTKAATAPATDLKPGQKININTASQDDLQLLPGIGPIKSQHIIDGRPYKKKEDIMKVKGIKEGSFAKIEDFITVE